jgi:hypothetical protein
MVAKVQTIWERLNGRVDLALREGDLYFSRQGSVWTAFRRIANFLESRQLPYAEIGGLAMFQHGFRQFTATIELLVSAPGYKALRKDFAGFNQSHDAWAFIEAESGVPASIALEGEQVGAGGVRFPSPATAAEIEDGLRFIRLSDLVSIKLSRTLRQESGTRDFADVQQLILALGLTQDFGATLYPQVCDSYRKICSEIDASCGEFLLLWEAGEEVSQVPSFDELVAANPTQAAMLRAMERDGVTICKARPSYKRHAVLGTTNRMIARKYNMHHESEYWFTDDP